MLTRASNEIPTHLFDEHLLTNYYVPGTRNTVTKTKIHSQFYGEFTFQRRDNKKQRKPKTPRIHLKDVAWSKTEQGKKDGENARK